MRSRTVIPMLGAVCVPPSTSAWEKLDQRIAAVQVMEEKVTDVNVDIATVAPEYHLFSREEVAEVLGRT